MVYMAVLFIRQLARYFFLPTKLSNFIFSNMIFFPLAKSSFLCL